MASGLWRSIACATTCAAMAATAEVCRSDDTSLWQRGIQRAGRIKRASMQLGGTFGLLATTVPEGSTKELFERLKVCTSCTQFRRLGEAGDGGYLTCMDGLVGGTTIRAAYSLGVAGNDKWSEDVYNILKVPVHQADCTVDSSPAQNCRDCNFHKVCLMGESGVGSHPVGPNMNMQQLFQSTGQASAPDDSLVMKMDIEGAEWPIFTDGNSGLNKLKQLIVEFHALGNEQSHHQYASALRNIEHAGFKVAHIHGNNCCGMYAVSNFTVPAVIEVTFMKSTPSLKVCETEQHLDPLDHRNLPVHDDLPMAHFPE